MQFEQGLPGLEVRAVLDLPVHLEGTAHLARHFLDPRPSTEHAGLTGGDRASGLGGSGHQARANVTGADVLGQRVGHAGLDAGAKRL